MGKKSGKQALFGDDGEDDGSRGLLADADAADAALGFDPEFARRFEHNKRREELHRLKEKNPRLAAKLEREAAREALGKASTGGESEDGDDDSEETSSSDDDDDLEELARRDDTDRVLEVLTRLKKKDPSIKQPEVRFFDDDEGSSGDDEEDGEAKKQKPVFLRQVLAEQALARDDNDNDNDDDDDDDDDGAARRQAKAAASRIPVYDDEQAQARAAFLSAAAAAADGGDEEADDGSGLVRRSKAAAVAAGDGDKDARVQKLLADYFGADEALDPDEKFLKDYIGSRRWLRDDSDSDSDGGGAEANRDNDPLDPVDMAEAEAWEEKADQFEHDFNFRHEHAGSGQIVGHPRQIPESVRKTDDKRARQRQLKKERKEAEKREAEEEIKRLKNAKKMEIQDKLKAVQEVAGVAAPDPNLIDALIDGDWDPEEYDRRMAAAFGDDYYDDDIAEQEDPEAVLKDERAAELLRQAGAIDEAEEEEEGVPMPIGAKKSTKSTKSTQQSTIDTESAAADARAEVSRLMEEYYALDYEGTAGGLRTRFRYRNVEPSTGGLSVDEILGLDDKVLNSIVSLKLLAPYREGKIRPNYKALQAAREARQQGGGAKGRRRPQHVGGRGGGPAVRLEREGEQKPWHQKWKGAEQQQQQQPQDRPSAQLDKQSARAASFAPLSLAGQKRREGGGGAGGAAGDGPAQKKGKGGGDGGAAAAAPAAATPAGPTLTKAQRKNLKRSLKRAAERQEKV